MMRKNKLYNIGICDIPSKENGKMTKAYITWYDMLRRCYNEKIHKKEPTYIGCTVCSEWFVFSNFKYWFDANYITNYHLDKDIITYGNKIYSPSTCCFVPSELNVLLNTNSKLRGLYPIGVSWKKRDHTFVASIKLYGKATHLGCYTNPEDAHNAWVTAKRLYATKLAETYFINNKISIYVKDAIIKYANNLR